jgi:hypothetical protein
MTFLDAWTRDSKFACVMDALCVPARMDDCAPNCISLRLAVAWLDIAVCYATQLVFSRWVACAATLKRCRALLPLEKISVPGLMLRALSIWLTTVAFTVAPTPSAVGARSCSCTKKA